MKMKKKKEIRNSVDMLFEWAVAFTKTRKAGEHTQSEGRKVLILMVGHNDGVAQFV